MDQVMAVCDAILQRGQHAILYGERGVGKTSLACVLSEFLDFLPVDRLLCPRVNCDRRDTFRSVWKKLLEEIVLVADRRRVGFGEAFDQEVTRGSDLLGDNPSPDSVRKVLTPLADQALPILIFDEFDRVPTAEKNAFADLVKMLSDHAVRATVILVGVADSVDELIEEHESVERALVQVRMPRMSADEIGKIISTGVRELEVEIEPAATEQIVRLSQGMPHYAHLLGLHSVRAAAHRRARSCIRTGDVTVALRRALDHAQQSIRSAFLKATESPRADSLHRQVLCACAIARVDELGYFAAADVRQPMRRITGRGYGVSAFARHLKEFCGERRGRVLRRVGSPRRYRYRFRNPLLQPFTIMTGLASRLLSSDMVPTNGSAVNEVP